MILFDCETTESIYQSIQLTTGVDNKALNRFLQKISEDELYDAFSDPDAYLLGRLLQEHNTTIRLDGICWFHLTRAPRNYSFDEGILPLGQVLGRIWDFLFSLVQTQISEKEWREFQHVVEQGKLNRAARLYKLKVSNPYQWGPFATLIRDFAFMADHLPIHDYFRTPEIVEDIAICFKQLYGIDLLRLFIEATVPCVVKFFDEENETDVIGTALHYLYVLIHNLEINILCNTNIDKRGETIPRERILKVDFPIYP